MKTVLVFGHLPKYAGGKQSSGLANVIWQLAKNMAIFGKNSFNIVFSATDIHSEKISIDGLNVIGWNKKILIKFIFKNFHFVLYYIFKTFKLSFKFRLNFFNVFFKLFFYHFSLRKVNPDYVHLHSCFSVIFFEIYNFKKYKVLATIHGLSGQDSNIFGYNYYRKMEKEMNNLPFCFVGFISSDLINQWINCYGSPIWKMVPILNSFDSSVFYYTTDDFLLNSQETNNTIVLATIGSISELKGQIRVIKALKNFSKSSFKYICIGEDNFNQIEGLIKEAGNFVNFEYKGYLNPNQIRHELSKIDFMILPSSSEGFGLVFLESIACGVPVILPKNLPIVQEEGLLTNENSVLLDDDSISSIILGLEKVKKVQFDREKTSNSIKSYTWLDAAKEYLNNLSICS